jgi:hypothetical protein
MTLTLLTVLAAAVLGGGLVAQLTLVAALAVGALVLIAFANGALLIRHVMKLYDA